MSGAANNLFSTIYKSIAWSFFGGVTLVQMCYVVREVHGHDDQQPSTPVLVSCTNVGKWRWLREQMILYSIFPLSRWRTSDFTCDWQHQSFFDQFLEPNKLGSRDSTVSSSVSTRQGPDSGVNYPPVLLLAWQCTPLAAQTRLPSAERVCGPVLKTHKLGWRKRREPKKKRQIILQKCSTNCIIKCIPSAQHKVQIKVPYPDQGSPHGSKNALVRCLYLTNIWFCSVQARVCICVLKNWTCFFGTRDLPLLCQQIAHELCLLHSPII